MKKETVVLDDMSEKAHKKIHNISFTFMALVVGVILFFLSQVIFALFINDFDEDIPNIPTANTEVTMDTDIGHYYCGTFYIWLTVGNNYKSPEAYKTAKTATTFTMKTTYGIADNIIVTAVPILLFICMFIAFRKADKKCFFAQNGWRMLMTAGIAYLIEGIWTVIRQLYVMSAEQQYVAGVFENRRYYCQIYQYFGIPALIIITALITRQHTLNIQKKGTNRNTKALKIMAVLIGTMASVFMSERFVTRVYEIIHYKIHDAMLPFYHELLSFPRELADSQEAYRNLLVFRLIKDIPVFIASAVTVIMLIKIMLSSAHNKINTVKNMKRFNISMTSLFISSLIFNIFGLHEVDMLNNHFSGIYSSVVYTIGIRALCEPFLYVIILLFVKTFVSISPNSDLCE